jgi:hypothetical protein
MANEIPNEQPTGWGLKLGGNGWRTVLLAGLLVGLVGVAGFQILKGGLPWKTAWIENLGGRVFVDSYEEGGDIKTVTSVFLVSRPVTDADLPPPDHWPEFQRLFLDGTKITDEGLARLEGLSQIEYLSLGNCRITDDGLEHLRPLSRLQFLNLTACPISDRGLQHLRDLKKLEKIIISFTNITPAGITELRTFLPLLKVATNREERD